MRSLAADLALLVIDVQRAFDDPSWGARNNPHAEANIAALLDYKTVNSAFIGTDLEAQLHARGVTAVVLVGITTDHGVSTTTRMAANLGFVATVVHDATCTFERTGPDGRAWSAEEMHTSALASLHDEFAVVSSTKDVLAAIVR